MTASVFHEYEEEQIANRRDIVGSDLGVFMLVSRRASSRRRRRRREFSNLERETTEIISLVRFQITFDA